ncbi:MAG: response regulator [Methanomicrobiales archaeon]
MTDILLVDDNPDICRIYHRMLSKMGYAVETVESGAEALSGLAEDRPALVLLDLMMEPMDGWEVLRRMRADDRMQDVPVIILTGKMLTPDDVLRYGDQIHGFVMKPLRRADLEDVVREFFLEAEDIEARTRNARERGVDEATIREYVALRHQVRVLTEMRGCLDRVLGGGDPDTGGDRPELADIRTRLDDAKARLGELETVIAG